MNEEEATVEKIVAEVRRNLSDVEEQAIVKVLLHIVKRLLPHCIEQNMSTQQAKEFFERVFENEVVRAWTVIQVIVMTEFEERA